MAKKLMPLPRLQKPGLPLYLTGRRASRFFRLKRSLFLLPISHPRRHGQRNRFHQNQSLLCGKDYRKKMLQTGPPEARDSVLTALDTLRNEGLFTPPDPKGTVLFPSTRGGANWGGAAYDPESGWLFINANETPEISTVKQVKQKLSPGKSLFERGRNFYLQHCATCHGSNLKGQHPVYPPLTDVEQRQSDRYSGW